MAFYVLLLISAGRGGQNAFALGQRFEAARTVALILREGQIAEVFFRRDKALRLKHIQARCGFMALGFPTDDDHRTVLMRQRNAVFSSAAGTLGASTTSNWYSPEFSRKLQL